MVKIPKHEDLSDFDAMMRQADSQIEEKQAEQDIVDRVPELRQLHTDIENATRKLESAIQKYNQTEINLNAAVKNIGDKVNTINTHIDDVVKNAPDKLKVTVHATDADMQHIQEQFDKHRVWVIGQMQKNLREVNDMFIDEHRRTINRYKEYDGVYLGRYSQWFVGFFFFIGVIITTTVIGMLISKANGWG